MSQSVPLSDQSPRLIQHIGSHPNLRQLIWTFSPLEDLLKWTCVSQDVFKEIVRVCYHTFPLHLRSSRVEGSSNVGREHLYRQAVRTFDASRYQLCPLDSRLDHDWAAILSLFPNLTEMRDFESRSLLKRRSSSAETPAFTFQRMEWLGPMSVLHNPDKSGFPLEWDIEYISRLEICDAAFQLANMSPSSWLDRIRARTGSSPLDSPPNPLRETVSQFVVDCGQFSMEDIADVLAYILHAQGNRSVEDLRIHLPALKPDQLPVLGRVLSAARPRRVNLTGWGYCPWPKLTPSDLSALASHIPPMQNLSLEIIVPLDQDKVASRAADDLGDGLAWPSYSTPGHFKNIPRLNVRHLSLRLQPEIPEDWEILGESPHVALCYRCLPEPERLAEIVHSLVDHPCSIVLLPPSSIHANSIAPYIYETLSHTTERELHRLRGLNSVSTGWRQLQPDERLNC